MDDVIVVGLKVRCRRPLGNESVVLTVGLEPTFYGLERRGSNPFLHRQLRFSLQVFVSCRYL